MLRNMLGALVVAGLAGSAGLATGTESAAAATAAGYIPVANPSSYVQPARWVYVPGRHGPRYAFRRPGFGYYYGGYWYARPWWTIDVGVPFGPVVEYAPIYGPRYPYWRPGFGFHHRGYWYRRRWW